MNESRRLLVRALIVGPVFGFFGQAEAQQRTTIKLVHETSPNWLSEVVFEARRRSKVETEREALTKKAILYVAQQGRNAPPGSLQLANSPKLDAAITKGIGTARFQENFGPSMEQRDGIKLALPHIAASVTIFEECGIDVPQPAKPKKK